jgi:hypothetical protein
MVAIDAVLLAILATSGNKTTPFVPGGIVAWIVCNSRKRNAIGGWLLYYYWQLYSSLVVSAVFFTLNIQSYVPENFDDKTRFAIFLTAALPSLFLLFLQTAVATYSLGVQTKDMLKLIRGILVAQVLVEVLATVLDANYFPDNQVFSILMLIQEGLWAAYFFRSARVRHIFSLQDWDIAVNSMYPPKLKVAT